MRPQHDSYFTNIEYMVVVEIQTIVFNGFILILPSRLLFAVC